MMMGDDLKRVFLVWNKDQSADNSRGQATECLIALVSKKKNKKKPQNRKCSSAVDVFRRTSVVSGKKILTRHICEMCAYVSPGGNKINRNLRRCVCVCLCVCEREM